MSIRIFESLFTMKWDTCFLQTMSNPKYIPYVRRPPYHTFTSFPCSHRYYWVWTVFLWTLPFYADNFLMRRISMNLCRGAKIQSSMIQSLWWIFEPTRFDLSAFKSLIKHILILLLHTRETCVGLALLFGTTIFFFKNTWIVCWIHKKIASNTN
jgi:hypothetical protein